MYITLTVKDLHSTPDTSVPDFIKKAYLCGRFFEKLRSVV
jgi:hypothetical protein